MSNNPEHKNEYGFKTVELPDYVAGDREPDHDQHISEITEIIKENENSNIVESNILNGRTLTNIGTFRA